MEQIPEFMPIERNTTGIRNEMQVRLAALQKESFDDFLRDHAEKFKIIVSQNPKILDEYELKPEETLEKVRAIIYH